MCTRYAIPDQETVEAELTPQRAWWKFQERFNVAPFHSVPVVRLHDGESEGVVMRWGLIPEWAKGEATAGPGLYAAGGGVEASRIFGGACRQSQRCLLPLAGFYIWELTSARHRQPHFVQFLGRPVFAVAGLWDRSVTEQDDVIESCAMFTVPANALLSEIQGPGQSMPAILSPEACRAWLHGRPEEARALLRTCSAEGMLTHPVSPRVNSLKYDDWQLARAVRA